MMHKDKHGKTSAKRVWGSIILTFALLMAIFGGFGIYNPDTSVLMMMFGTGCGVLGMGTFER